MCLMWRRRIILFLACAALVIAAGVFVRTWRAAHRVNVLLITLDTTRADRLGCYGYAKAETPALDRLAAQGVRFTRAFAQAPLTAPSHTCMLTGLCPPEHGVRDNGRSKLPENVPTLAESFRQRGYRTAAFLANFVLDRRFGLDRGFETYDDRMTVVGKFASAQENPANVVCDRALAWLGENTVRGFFCWVHFYDPHDPYAPPEPFKSRLQDPYDGEIAFMDSQIQRLLEFLDRRGLSDRTLVIVCGDHGQSFGEHEERGHGILVYKATMLVPLMVRMPGRILPGLDDRVARPVDIPATVAEVLKWRPGSHPFAAARRPNPRDAEGRRGTARSDERP